MIDIIFFLTGSTGESVLTSCIELVHLVRFLETEAVVTCWIFGFAVPKFLR